MAAKPPATEPLKREMPGQSAPFFWHFLGPETDREITKCRVKRAFKKKRHFYISRHEG